ncbi:MAG: AMP-binding protein [Sphaerochaetaceae bacterium]|nr:AMP-binding protein [Sphaerochaetaceae bacterium]
MKHELETFTIRHILERSAERHSKRLALSLIGNEKERYTYKELKESVDSIATYLIRHGVKKGDKIAILSESQPKWGVAYLSIISAGAIAVPILPDFSAKEIETILNHSEAASLFVSSKLIEKIGKTSIESFDLLMRIDDLFHIPAVTREILTSKGEFLDAPGRAMERTRVQAKALGKIESKEGDIVSIIYTSGTTGSSKGVVLTNRNLSSNASASVSQFFKIKTGMRFLSILPLSHSYEFTIGFLLPLVTGCEIHYLGKPPAASLLLPALKRIRPHVMLSVPLLIEKIYRSSVVPQIEGNKNLKRWYNISFMRKEINRIIGRKLKITFGSRLRFFGIGGAALDSQVEKFLKEARFPYSIGYGLTETSPLLAGSGPRQTKVGTVGYALKGVSLKIDNPDPKTKVGEIVAKGPNVMEGYYKADELTKESFTEDGYFKTGDLGIIVRNRLSIKGRSKTMILGPGGENIYPEIIEALINNRPYVQESLVIESEAGLGALIKIDLELMAENLKKSVEEVREEASHYVNKVKEEVNKELSSFSRIRETKLHNEPFQRTPTLKIKRYLYTLTHRKEHHDEKEHKDSQE